MWMLINNTPEKENGAGRRGEEQKTAVILIFPNRFSEKTK